MILSALVMMGSLGSVGGMRVRDESGRIGVKTTGTLGLEIEVKGESHPICTCELVSEPAGSSGQFCAPIGYLESGDLLLGFFWADAGRTVEILPASFRLTCAAHSR